MITNVTLTTKEKFLLEDAKTHEENCIKKYNNYTQLACDSQLKAVFRANGEKEEEHLQTINQLLNGEVPSVSQGNKQQSATGKTKSQQASVEEQSSGSSVFKASDKELCTDMLMTEKYVSSTYDTAIFEFKDTQVRDTLNHIQKEEQKHGEAIFAYMQSKGMYSPS